MNHPSLPARLYLAVACLAFAGSTNVAWVDGLQGQTVTGHLVVSEGDGLEGAMVTLVNRAGQSQGQVLTNGSGEFEVTAVQPGEFQLRADRIGHASTFTDFFTLTTGDTISFDLVARVEAVRLTGINVEGDRRCRVRPEEGLAVTRVWDEARKALALAAWTQDRGLYEYEMMNIRRSLDRDARRVLSDDRRPQRGQSKAPYVALPAAQLIEEGFASLTVQEAVYYAPDAEVLLSDAFLDTHCFGLSEGKDEAEGLIGLSFKPVPGRQVPDIAGTIWLDPETAQLRWLDFSYERLGLPTELDTDLIGGKVEFSALPNGTWIVDSWRIRMPRTGVTDNPVNGRRQPYLEGFTEQGGEVIRVHGNTGTVLAAAAGGSIMGAVFDSLRTGGLAGARVFIEGTNFEATTGFNGRFSLTGLDPGIYTVGFTHPYLDALAFSADPFEVEVGQDATAQINFLAPPRRRLIAALCENVEGPKEDALIPGDGAHPAQGILVGQVTDKGGQPVTGATVRVLWREWSVTYDVERPSRDDSVREGRLGITAITNASGHYVSCWLPADIPLDVVALTSMDDLDPGRQRAFREASDVMRADRELFMIPSSTQMATHDLVLDLAQTGTLVVTVRTSADGAPVQGVPVRVPSLGRVEYTDATGQCRFSALPVGIHPFQAEAPGQSPVAGSATVTAGQIHRLDLALPVGGS